MTSALAIAGGFMIHAFLEFGATGQFSLSYLKLGPVEIRLVFIGINTTLLTFGRSSMVAAVPPVLLISGGVLISLVCRT